MVTRSCCRVAPELIVASLATSCALYHAGRPAWNPVGCLTNEEKGWLKDAIDCTTSTSDVQGQHLRYMKGAHAKRTVFFGAYSRSSHKTRLQLMAKYRKRLSVRTTSPM